MQTKFMMEGNTVSVVKLNDELALDYLPPKVYTIRYSDMFGFYLTITKDKLVVPKKVYGQTIARVKKCLDTYNDRSSSTGILLTGDKGTGKSLTMSLLANDAISTLGLPVLLVKEAHQGEKFTSFLESIGPCCLVFDEFGKMYRAQNNIDSEKPSQTALLSLMDGVDKTKRLMVFTENDEFDINEFMLNRPSRIYYHFRFHKLDEDSIEGYCVDNDVSRETIDDLIELSRRSKIFSFDMLQSIIEEHKRFGEKVETIIADLNIDVKKDADKMIEVIKIVEKSTEAPRELYGTTPFISKPGRWDNIRIKKNSDARSHIPNGFTSDIDAEDTDDDEYESFSINEKHLSYEYNGQLVYDCDEFIVIAKDVPVAALDYWKLL